MAIALIDLGADIHTTDIHGVLPIQLTLDMHQHICRCRLLEIMLIHINSYINNVQCLS